MTRYVYVGGGTRRADGTHTAEGIAVFRFVDGRLEPAGSMASGKNPSFLALHPNRKFLYAVNEGEGTASAFAIDTATGGLTLLNSVGVVGDGPCYVTVSPDGTRVLIANYSSGSLTVLPVLEDGRLGEALQKIQHEGYSGAGGEVRSIDEANDTVLIVERGMSVDARVQPKRQEHAHAHSVIFDPSGQYVLSADLGMDRIWVYAFRDGLLAAPKGAVQGNTQDGVAEYRWQEQGWQMEGSGVPVAEFAGVSSAPGAGPRHMAFHPNGQYLYVANELDSTVGVYRWSEGGVLQHLEVVTTLPDGFTGENTTAQILLTPDGRNLYVSNRGHNSIAAFSVDAATGKLTALGQISSGGNWPRNFAIDPDGQYLLAANQYSNDVVVFRIDPVSGWLEATGARVDVNEPMMVLFVDFP